MRLGRTRRRGLGRRARPGQWLFEHGLGLFHHRAHLLRHFGGRRLLQQFLGRGQMLLQILRGLGHGGGVALQGQRLNFRHPLFCKAQMQLGLGGRVTGQSQLNLLHGQIHRVQGIARYGLIRGIHRGRGAAGQHGEG